MPNFGGSTPSNYHPVNTGLYGRQNELIAWKPQTLSGSVDDWWLGAGSPDALDVAGPTYRSRGLLFYDRRAVSTAGLLCWIDEQSVSKTDFAFAAPLNRNQTVSGVWTYNLAPRTPSGSNGTRAPFVLGGNHAETGNRLENWVQYLNVDRLDGYHATSNVSENEIPVRGYGGQIKVPLEPIDNDHAASKLYVDNSRAGFRVRTAVILKTVAALPTHSYNAGTKTMTATGNGALSIDGTAVVVGQRVIISEEPTAPRNGVATVTATGSVGTPWVLRYVYGTNISTENPDPDGVGDYDYNDYFAVSGGNTNLGSTWVLSGDAGDYYFNLFQISQPLSEGRGITIASARVHFWKSSFSSAEINTFTYVKTDTNGSNAIGSMGMYGASGTYALKGASNRLPKVSGDAGALFTDSLLTDDGAAIFPSTSVKLGTSAKPWTEFWTQPAAPGGKLAHVSGHRGTDQLVARTWGDFITDITGDLPFSSYTPTSRTLQITSPDSSISVTQATPVDLTANRSWTLAVNWNNGKGPLGLNGTYTDYSLPFWLSDRFTDSPLRYDTTWASGQLFRGRVLSTETGMIEVQFQTATPGAPVWFKLADLPVHSTNTNDPVYVEARGGFWGNRNMNGIIRAYLGNRGNPINTNLVSWEYVGASPTSDASTIATNFSIEMRRAVSGAASIWMRISSNYTSVCVSVYGTGSLQTLVTATVTKNTTGTLIAPTDTLVFNTADVATYPPNMIHDMGTVSVRTRPNGGKLASVAGFFGSSSVLNSRPWATFVSDVQSDLNITGAQVSFTASAVAYGGPDSKLKGDVNRIRFDETNNRLGIGIATSPAFTLDIHGEGTVRINSPAPRLTFGDSDGAVNNKRFDIVSNLGVFSISASNDAGAAYATAFEMTSNGLTVTDIKLTGALVTVEGNQYVNGRLGIDVNAPAALLHIGAGSVSVPPVRFNSSTNALTSTPVAGSLETDLSSAVTRGRLYFTDGTAARRGIAFTDEIGFTNDPSAEIGGAVVFPGAVAGAMLNAQTSEILGAQPFSVWIRAQIKSYPNPASTYPSIFSLFSSTSPDPTIFFAYMDNSGDLVLVSRQGAIINDASVRYTGIRNQYGGKIVDVVVTRDSTGIKLFINGSQVQRSSGAVENDSKWQRDMSASLSFRPGSYSNSNTNTYNAPIYRAVVWNRSLTALDVLNLSLVGVDPTDHGGSTVPSYSSNFSATNDGWSASNGTLAAGQTIGAQSNALRIVSNGSSPTFCLAFRGTMPRGRRARITGRYYLPASNSVARRARNGFYNTGILSAVLPQPSLDTWTSFSNETPFGDFAENGSNGNWDIYMADVSGNINGGFPSGDAMYLHDFKVYQVGILVDLDLSVGIGTVIPDRTGRYPGILTGSGYQHLIPKPTGSTDGTYFGVRKYVSTISAKDGDVKDVVHGLGSEAVTVEVWDAAHRKVEVSVSRKTGDTANAVSIGFALFGAPSVNQSFTVVVTG